MAIVKMKQFELIVLKKDLDALLLELQRYKEVSFLELNEKDVENINPSLAHYDFEDNKIKQEHIKNTLNQLKQYRKKLNARGQKIQDIGLKERTFEELFISDLEELDTLLDRYSEYYEASIPGLIEYKHFIPWQHKTINIEELRTLSDQDIKVGTYAIEETNKLVKELNKNTEIFYILKETKEYGIIMAMCLPKDEEELDIIFETYDIEPRSIYSLHLESIEENMRELLDSYIYKRDHYLDRMDALVKDQEKLEIHYERLRNEYRREKVKEKAKLTDKTSTLAGWIKAKCEDEFIQLVEKTTHGNTLIEIYDAPEHSQDVPILLENNKFVESFEPITTMYAMPRYDEIDPTPWFAPFYAFFFGMMLADLGYGIIMVITMLFALKYVKMKPNTQKMIRLLAIVGVTTAFWGFIYGSFFGGIIPMTPIIDINKDFTFVLILALGLGIFHLFTGLAIKGYMYARDYKKRYILYDVIFWMMLFGGSVVLISGMFTTALQEYNTIASFCAIAGAVGIVLTNGRDAKTIPGKFASGLYSLYGFSNYVGDVVSYSRLMALGLAGASIGMAFNMMVSMLGELGVIGIVFGVIVFIFGHTFNLLINGLSAYVHSARLTYVEFFGKFYSGGGKAFKSFQEEPTYVQIKED